MEDDHLKKVKNKMARSEQYTRRILTGKGKNIGGDKTYQHTQSSAAATWVITHNLNKKPSVSVSTLNGDVWVIADVTYNSDDQVTLTFSGAQSGYAYLN